MRFDNTPEDEARAKFASTNHDLTQIVCPRPCADCRSNEHHWLDQHEPGDPDDEDDHGRGAIQRCKHCDAWRDYPDDDEEEEDF